MGCEKDFYFNIFYLLTEFPKVCRWTVTELNTSSIFGTKEVMNSLMFFDVYQQDNVKKSLAAVFTWTFSSTLKLQKVY